MSAPGSTGGFTGGFTRRFTPRGFTLIEVLVALTIVAFGLTALFTTVNQAVRTSAYLREKTLATWIALNRITEARVSGQLPTGDELKGTVEFAGANWRWELETVETPVADILRLQARAAPADSAAGYWPGQATGFIGSAVAAPHMRSKYAEISSPDLQPGAESLPPGDEVEAPASEP